MFGDLNDWKNQNAYTYGGNTNTLTIYLPYLDKTYGKLDDIWDGQTFRAGQNGCTLWGYFNYMRQRNTNNPKLQVIGY